MNDSVIAADVVEVVETGFIKTEHVFRTTNEILGVLTFNAGKTRGSYAGSDGTLLRFKRTNFWKSNYDLEQDGAVLSSAAPSGKLSRAFVFGFEGNVYGFFPGGRKFRHWVVKNEIEEVLCEIGPRGAFKRGALIRFFYPVPIVLVVFVFCLVSKRWQE